MISRIRSCWKKKPWWYTKCSIKLAPLRIITLHSPRCSPIYWSNYLLFLWDVNLFPPKKSQQVRSDRNSRASQGFPHVMMDLCGLKQLSFSNMDLGTWQYPKKDRTLLEHDRTVIYYDLLPCYPFLDSSNSMDFLCFSHGFPLRNPPTSKWGSRWAFPRGAAGSEIGIAIAQGAQTLSLLRGNHQAIPQLHQRWIWNPII